MSHVVLLVVALAAPVQKAAPPVDEGRREHVGEVLGQPVYRDQIRTGKDARLAAELHRLFAAPVVRKYREAHKAEIEPTPEEIDAADAYFRAEHRRRAPGRRLDPPGRDFAVFVLTNWKFQRHLYDRFGGGRVLWQQAGLEAFDANRKWLEALERQGQFRITDPELRKAFYAYWTTMNHGSFLFDDPERIRTEFLEPEWAKGGGGR